MNGKPPDPGEAEARAHRAFVNLVAAIALILLAAAAFWLLKAMNDRQKLEKCLNLGRRDCGDFVQPAN